MRDRVSFGANTRTAAQHHGKVRSLLWAKKKHDINASEQTDILRFQRKRTQGAAEKKPAHDARGLVWGKFGAPTESIEGGAKLSTRAGLNKQNLKDRETKSKEHKVA